MKKNRAIMTKSFLASVLAVLLLCNCKGKSEKAVDNVVHNVMVVTPVNQSEAAVRNFTGVVKENATVSLSFRTAGQIARILVKEGDYVRKGQLLAVLDTKDYRLQVDAAETQYGQLKSEVERLKILYEGKSLSANDYEKAESGLKQVGIQLQNARNQLSYTRLTSTVAGAVQSINFEQGEIVNAGLPVIDIVDTHRMEVEVNIPADIYARHKNFAGAYCMSNGRRFTLHQVGIMPKADANQLFKVRYAVDGRLNAGQSVDVFIELKNNSAAEQLTIPHHAVFEKDGKSFVWVVGDDNIVKQREVTLTRMHSSGDVFVTSGLKSNERVVKAGVSKLHEGEKVKVVKQEKTNVGDLL